MNADETIGLPWIVLSGFVRIATSARIFSAPLSVSDALVHVDNLLAHPLTTIVTEKTEHWKTLQALLIEAGAAGNLTTDAHLATLAITHGATLASCDTDFARFRQQGLRWENPLTSVAQQP